MNDLFKCPGHSDGNHVRDWDGSCMGKGCNYRFDVAIDDAPEARDIIESLIACHEEPTCPAVTLAREFLATQRAAEPDRAALAEEVKRLAGRVTFNVELTPEDHRTFDTMNALINRLAAAPAPAAGTENSAVETLAVIARFLGIDEAEEKARPGYDGTSPVSRIFLAAIERFAKSAASAPEAPGTQDGEASIDDDNPLREDMIRAIARQHGECAYQFGGALSFVRFKPDALIGFVDAVARLRPVAPEGTEPYTGQPGWKLHRCPDGQQCNDKVPGGCALDHCSRVAPEATEGAPIDMVLHCPACGRQHIDAPERNPTDLAGDEAWHNPPHRSHLCHGCDHIWRPADVPTNGVQAVTTRGQNDSPAKEATEGAQGEPVAWRYEIATAKAWAPGEHYTGWQWRLGTTEPCVPEGSIRNLAPLYAAPQACKRVTEVETLPLFRAAIAWGKVYGDVINVKQWDDERDRKARQLIARLAAQQEPVESDDDLHTFLNAAAGEGYVLDGIDAADLYVKLFPERYAAATTKIAPKGNHQ